MFSNYDSFIVICKKEDKKVSLGIMVEMLPHDYKPGGLRNGTQPRIPSTSIGTLSTRLMISGEDVLAFHVLYHGPPPVSSAAILLVTSRIIYKWFTL